MQRLQVEIACGDTLTASSKARDDVTAILEGIGFETMRIRVGDSQRYSDLVRDMSSSYKQLKQALKQLDRESVLIYQYPWNSQAISFAHRIRSVASQQNATTIVIVHDLNLQRTSSLLGRKYYEHVVREYAFLDCFDYVICHNASMAEHLFYHGLSGDKIITLGIFDYLLKDSDQPVYPRFSKTISIAGNLSREKAPYVHMLENLHNDTYEFELYGIGYEGHADAQGITYNGSFGPEALCTRLDHGFGLVWDGDSLDGCMGPLGKYERLNNPHKLSLYLSCGLPVIVWSQAAIAPFVREHGLGVCVDSLANLAEVMDCMTPGEYASYAGNVSCVRKRITSGCYLREALQKVHALTDVFCEEDAIKGSE